MARNDKNYSHRFTQGGRVSFNCFNLSIVCCSFKSEVAMNYMRATNFMMLGGLMLGVCVEHSGDQIFPLITVKYEKNNLSII